MRRMILIFRCLVLLLCGSASAWATCSASTTMGGKWNFFKTWQDGDGNQRGLTCAFVLTADGTISSGTCRGVRTDGSLATSFTISGGGRFVVNSACAVTGTIVTIANDEGFRVVTSRLEPNKNIVGGIAADIDYFNGGAVSNTAMFTMVRY